jgi:hypothetical protein
MRPPEGNITMHNTPGTIFGPGMHPFTRKQWYEMLPRELRVLWLEETKLETKMPSQSLMNTMSNYLNHNRRSQGS